MYENSRVPPWGSTGSYFHGFGKQVHSFGDLGSGLLISTGGEGRFFGKKKRSGPAFAIKKIQEKKKARIRPAEAEKGKGRKIERARENREKRNQSIR